MRCASFEGLGVLAGQAQSRASALSGDGAVAFVQGQASDLALEALVWGWEGNQLEPLSRYTGDVALHAQVALAASRDGSLAVGQGVAVQGSAPFPILWSPNFGTRRLAAGLLPEGRAEGVSVDGRVVVGYRVLGQDRFAAFRWTVEEGPADLMLMLGGDSARAYGISADGSVIVGEGSNAAGPRRAFRWADGAMTGIGALSGGNVSWASGSNADGSVVVGVSADGTGWQAFRWLATAAPELRMTGLFTMAEGEPAPRSDAAGTTVVGTSLGQAVLWNEQEGGVRSIEELVGEALPSGWRLVSAAAVSEDGKVVVGTATLPGGEQQAWRWVRGPRCEPEVADAGSSERSASP